MKTSILCLLSVIIITAFSGTLAWYSDSDSEIPIHDPADGFETDRNMREFNKKLDSAVEVVNELYKLALEKATPVIKSRVEKLKTMKKPKKYTEEEWENFKNGYEQMLKDRLYRKISTKHFRDYGNFVTDLGSQNNDTMFKYGKDGKELFEYHEEWKEELEKNEI